MNHPSTLIFALGLISLVLAGCASTKDAVLPQDGPSMKAIYDDHVQEMNARDPQVIRHELGNRPILTGEAALQGYTRDAFNEIDLLHIALKDGLHRRSVLRQYGILGAGAAG